MSTLRPFTALAASAALAVALSGCAGGPQPQPENGQAGQVGQAAPDAPAASEADAAPASSVGGSQTTGLDWPAEWPARFPRVGGEIIAADSNAADGVFSVVMYVEPGVSAQLVEALKAQSGLSVLTDDSTESSQLVAFSNADWRIDVIGVLQQDTERPHLRYLVQSQ